MIRLKSHAVWFCVFALLLSPARLIASDKPFLSAAFGDHMVLQRDKPNTFWGWTRPGERVTLWVGDQHAETTAGSDGKWIVRLMPPKTGGPYTVIIDGSRHLELSDVMVGDVWICSGQSNMEFGITMEKDAASEIAQANDTGLRLYVAPRQVGLSPQQTNEGRWIGCSPETVVKDGWGGFSAVGYHFGHALRRELGVPVGLVEISWSGTPAQAWTSADSLARLGDFAPGLELIDLLRKQGSPPYSNYLDLWLSRNDAGSRPGADWQSPDLYDANWTSVKVPDGFSDAGMSQKKGVVWFRKTIYLPDPLPAGGATLSLGSIGQLDQTWVNGVPVGSGGWWSWPRNYGLWPHLLKTGNNVITVRVIAKDDNPGFHGPADLLFLKLGDGSRVPLVDGWKARVGAVIGDGNPGPPSYDQFPNLPTELFNGMIAPQLPMAIRGAIWYQGEANADRAFQYRTLLPAMIANWRTAFGQGNFPFYIVSLAAYQPHKDFPGDDEWAELREAQALTSQNIPNSGLAMAIDVGDPNDIHPKDKKTVGERLARLALANEYGKSTVFSGPVYRAMQREGSAIRLSFDHTEGGLRSSGPVLGEFSVAGADRKWHWAQARIDNNAVMVSSSDVPEPLAVRYAWQADPTATLVNGAGLPAVPFRTDDWTEITAGSK